MVIVDVPTSPVASEEVQNKEALLSAERHTCTWRRGSASGQSALSRGHGGSFRVRSVGLKQSSWWHGRAGAGGCRVCVVEGGGHEPSDPMSESGVSEPGDRFRRRCSLERHSTWCQDCSVSVPAVSESECQNGSFRVRSVSEPGGMDVLCWQSRVSVSRGGESPVTLCQNPVSVTGDSSRFVVRVRVRCQSTGVRAESSVRVRCQSPVSVPAVSESGVRTPCQNTMSERCVRALCQSRCQKSGVSSRCVRARRQSPVSEPGVCQSPVSVPAVLSVSEPSVRARCQFPVCRPCQVSALGQQLESARCESARQERSAAAQLEELLARSAQLEETTAQLRQENKRLGQARDEAGQLAAVSRIRDTQTV